MNSSLLLMHTMNALFQLRSMLIVFLGKKKTWQEYELVQKSVLFAYLQGTPLFWIYFYMSSQ